MALTVNEKKEAIEHFKQHDNDTGSPEVQIALLTKRITYLTEHFKNHKHDYHSRNGLIKLIGQRRKLLNYLQKKNINRYRKIINQLNLRK